MRIQKFRKWTAVLLLVGVPLGVFAQMADEDLLRRADEARFLEADSFTFTLRLIAERAVQRPDGREEVVRSEALLKVFHKRFPEGMRTRVEFLEPESLRGTVYLILGDEIFFWQPGLLQPIRISGQQRLFGDASVAEAVGIRFQTYEVRERERTELGGQETIKLELEAQSPQQAFPRVTLWMDPEALRPVQAVLSALSGTPLKRVTYREYARFEGDEYAADILIEDLLFQEGKTAMHIGEIAIEELDDALFDPDRLGR